MSDRTPPHDLTVEESLLGAMMLTREARQTGLRNVTAADFYKPAHGHIFDAVARLHGDGGEVDPVTIGAELGRAGLLDAVGGLAMLTTIQSNTPATTSVARYARIVVEHAARRRLIHAARQLAEAAWEQADPGELIDRHKAALDAIDLPAGRTDGLVMLDDLLDRPDDQRTPWVVRGLLRQDWRAVVVAAEGVGKSLLLQQIAVCAAQGIHPLRLQHGHRPVRALLVDAENPDERIVQGCKPIRDHVRRHVGISYEPGRAWLWHRPAGLDLRTRADRAALESVLTATQPELVCMGPAYKLAERRSGEGWDEGARAVQSTLDDLRARYRFALVMEDHAPQGTGGSTRELRPFGSSLWLRWPELGLKLVRDKDEHPPRTLKVDRWRGDRLANDWPAELHRGNRNSFPWEGYWPGGMGDDRSAA